MFCAKFNWNWANGFKEVGNLKSLQTTDWWTLDKRWYEKFTAAFMRMCAERILWLEIQEGPHVGFSILPCYTLFRWSKYFHLQCLYILFHYQCIFKTVKLMHHIYFSIIYKFINKWYFFKKNSFSVMCTNCFNTYFKYCKVIIEMDIEQVIASFWKFLPNLYIN